MDSFLHFLSKSEIVIQSLSEKYESAMSIKKISVLGNKGDVKWSRDDNALKVKMPDKKLCKYAYAIKIELK